MIEFCTKKRMGIAILFLIFVSVIVLVFENKMSMDHDLQDVPSSSENGSDECLKTGTILKLCRPCSKFDMSVIPICTVSGYVELIRCPTKDGEKNISRSCPKHSWVDERNFWIFEFVTAIVGLGAYSIVHIRQRTLDRLLLEKVHKQIASGV